MHFTGIKVFVPSKDFEVEKGFYVALGGEVTFQHEMSLAGIRFGDEEFLLQNFYVKEWAENFMMQIGVEDLSGWAEKLDGMVASGQFPGIRYKGPVDEPWGQRILYVWAPSGVLVHLVQELG